MRELTDEEINQLEDNGCTAEDWTAVQVDEDFRPAYVRNTHFFGDIEIGALDNNIEVAPGFMLHSGIYNATLRNVSMGNNCLVRNIGQYINNYTLGDDCYVSNVAVMETTDGATYGQGNIISVLNEVGPGNVMFYRDINAQTAAFMVKYANNARVRECLRQMIAGEVQQQRPERGCLGNKVKVTNTREIVNTVIESDCEVDGASRLSDCTLLSSTGNGVYVGTGVIAENTIISEGCSVINSVKIQDCFVGEQCQLSNGFTASASVFFANSFMSNGEACAAFCGPFTASHHKSTLLIGGMFSFYNAGSATNFSNHAYKMGPLHWGVLERGCKTASGAYLLMPAHLGAFSVCFGKLMHHPDTRNLPFSYLIAGGDTMYLVPGRNITTVGLYRDIRKWPQRDMRPKQAQKSIVNFDWLSPYTVDEILRGKQVLEALRQASGDNVTAYNYHEYVIKATSLQKGINAYDMALRIYMGAVLKRQMRVDAELNAPQGETGKGAWTDLAGLLMPLSEEEHLCDDLLLGNIATTVELNRRLRDIAAHYEEYRWAWTYSLICQYYGISTIAPADAERIHADYVEARRQWIDAIRKDARREFDMGDVQPDVLNKFLAQLDAESNFEEA